MSFNQTIASNLSINWTIPTNSQGFQLPGSNFFAPKPPPGGLGSPLSPLFNRFEIQVIVVPKTLNQFIDALLNLVNTKVEPMTNFLSAKSFKSLPSNFFSFLDSIW